MARTGISPNFYVDPDLGDEVFQDVVETKPYPSKNINTKIAIYADRVRGWFLRIAQDLKEDNEAGFIILMICLAHLEGLAQFRRGETSEADSSKILREEVMKVFAIPSFNQKAADILVKDARHGLFHDCMTRKRILLSTDYTNPLVWDSVSEVVLVNPHTFLDMIIMDFERYVTTLVDPVNTSERELFERMFGQ